MKATEMEIIYPRMLLYGDYGCGKTYTVGLIHKRIKQICPASNGVYLFDFDKGSPTLKTMGADVEVEYFVDKDPRYPDAWDKMQDRFTMFEEDPQGYHVLCMDSLTSLHTAALFWTIANNVISGRQIGRVRLANVNDYGPLTFMFNQFFPQMLRISERMIYILTAHIREREHPVTKEIALMPAITGKSLPSQIGDWFNEVWFQVCEDGKRFVQTQSGDRVKTKTQIANMPAYLPLEEALDRLFEGYGLNNLQVQTQTQTGS